MSASLLFGAVQAVAARTAGATYPGANGRIAYSTDGKPRSVIEPMRIRAREHGGSLRQLEGAVPDLTGGLSDDEYLDALRRNG